MGRVLLDAVSETILTVFFFVVRFFAWGIQWSIATVFFVLVMAGAGYYVFNYALSTGTPTTVPDVLDLPVNESSLILAERGLDMGKQTRVPHPTAPKDHVIAQRPEAGRVVREGRKVYLTVSLGADVLTAPSLVNLRLDDARRTITESRFRLGSVARVPNDAARDTVLAQDPPAGLGIANQGSISLLVSGGNETSTNFMPDIRGMNVQEMLRVLAPYRLTLVPRQTDIQGAKPDTVLSQDPAPDTLIYPGQVVTYEVKASGTEPLPSNEVAGRVKHVMPYDWFDKSVRVDKVNADGSRETLDRRPPAFDDDARRTRLAGWSLNIRFKYVGEARIEIYVDDKLVESYVVKEGQEARKGGA